jgi:hypothetical protein
MVKVLAGGAELLSIFLFLPVKSLPKEYSVFICTARMRRQRNYEQEYDVILLSSDVNVFLLPSYMLMTWNLFIRPNSSISCGQNGGRSEIFHVAVADSGLCI